MAPTCPHPRHHHRCVVTPPRLNSYLEGWPGIRSPEAKDYLASHQITAEGWYVAHPDLTVTEIHRLKRIGKAVDELLDQISA